MPPGLSTSHVHCFFRSYSTPSIFHSRKHLKFQVQAVKRSFRMRTNIIFVSKYINSSSSKSSSHSFFVALFELLWFVRLLLICTTSIALIDLFFSAVIPVFFNHKYCLYRTINGLQSEICNWPTLRLRYFKCWSDAHIKTIARFVQ